MVKYFTIYNDLAQLRKNVIEFIFLRVGNLTTSFVVIDDVPSEFAKKKKCRDFLLCTTMT